MAKEVIFIILFLALHVFIPKLQTTARFISSIWILIFYMLEIFSRKGVVDVAAAKGKSRFTQAENVSQLLWTEEQAFAIVAFLYVLSSWINCVKQAVHKTMKWRVQKKRDNKLGQ